ncbi:MAG TPA: helix-turn-helix domain-containing protein [Roseococcus sp.]|jgi:DNA-binding MarR family transcriptional regulator|nr:helix-turn-helix domain-containing protein [Roseococcus sp.]
MSIQAIAWAWAIRTTPTRKLVLLALADHADQNGECYPSLARIAAHTGLSERGIRIALREMEADGTIETKHGGGNRASVYRLPVDGEHSARRHRQDVPPSGRQPRHDMPPSPGHDMPPTGAPRAGEGGTTCRSPGHHVPPNRHRTISNRHGTKREARETRAPAPEPSPHRGHRLPEDWRPGPGAPPGDLEAFRDYWRAVPGAKGLKLDWDATWRTWQRREAQRQRPTHRDDASARRVAAFRATAEEAGLTVDQQGFILQ